MTYGDALWQINPNASDSANDEQLTSAFGLLHLSGGDLVTLLLAPNMATPTFTVNAISRDRKTATEAAPQERQWDQSATGFGVGNVSAGGLQNTCVCRDNADNLYLFSAYGTSAAGQMACAYMKKNTPGQGFAAPVFCHGTYGDGTTPTLRGVDAVWCNTGGGTSGLGHILVIWNDSTGVNGYTVLDAGALQGGTFTATASGVSPAFLSTTTTQVNGNNLCVAPAGFGATSGLALCAGSGATYGTISIGSWAVGSTGTLTTNVNVGTLSSSLSTSYDKPHLLWLGGSNWVAIYPSPSADLVAIWCSTSGLGTPAAMGAANLPGFPTTWTGSTGGHKWAAYADPTGNGKAWVVVRHTSAGTPVQVLRVGVHATSTGTTWDSNVVPVANSLWGDGTLRVPRQPVGYAVDVVLPITNNYPVTANVNGMYIAHGPKPAAPTLTAPAYGAVADLAAGATFGWTPDPLAPHDAYALHRVDAGGNGQWWSGSAWVDGSQGEVWIAGSASQVTFGAGLWLDGNEPYTWHVLTSSNGIGSATPNAFSVTGGAPPTFAASVAHADTANPTVGGTATPGTVGDGISLYRVVVGPSGWNPANTVPTFDSGWLAGPFAAVQVTTNLAQGAWDAYVQLRETNGATNGNGTKASFTVSYTALSTPSVAVAQAADATTGEPYVAATVTWSVGSMTGNVQVVLTRSDGVVVRDQPTVAASTATATVHDYEAALGGGGYTYTAQLVQATGNGNRLSAASAVSPGVTLADRRVWVHLPTDTTTGLAIGVRSHGDATRPISQGVFVGLGSDTEVVVSDVRRKRTGKFVAYCPDMTTSANLLALLDRNPTPVLVLRRPSPDPAQYGTLLYFAPTGDVAEGPVERVNTKERQVTFGYTEQGRP